MPTGAIVIALAVVATAQPSPSDPQSLPRMQSSSQSLVTAPSDSDQAKPWRIGPMEVSGLLDGYYSYNANGPSTAANGKINDLYNFDDKTNQFNMSAAKLTLNHDPSPLGARIDLYYGRTSHLINTPGQLEFFEQSYFSVKPRRARGFEVDAGKFVTSAGAEVIESKDNWNYSRSLLFAWAIPYYHFGLRTSMPVSKMETIGVQLVNGWNNVTNSTGGVTTGLTSAFVKTKYSLNANVYTGPEAIGPQNGYRNLADLVLIVTPTARLSAYGNYDNGRQNTHAGSAEETSGATYSWQGIAFAAREQLTRTMAVAGRSEYFKDAQGYCTGVAQNVKEITGTYEYRTAQGLMGRLEYRRDWSDQPYFHRGGTQMIDHQQTLTLGMVMAFTPKR